MDQALGWSARMMGNDKTAVRLAWVVKEAVRPQGV